MRPEFKEYSVMIDDRRYFLYKGSNVSTLCKRGNYEYCLIFNAKWYSDSVSYEKVNAFIEVRINLYNDNVEFVSKYGDANLIKEMAETYDVKL